MLITDKFDHYEILAPLGKGGMGEVYRARDIRLNREIAIKVLPAEFAQDADRLRRFEQEAMATSALNHPNILTVYDFGTGSPENGGNPYLVMELLEGAELREPMNDGAIPMRKVIEYAQQIAAGLAAAHEKGVVHRDLKPENLFVTKDGRVKILDFGLAKLRPPRNVSAGSDVATQKQHTTPGTVMGTVAYMSPEQARGEPVDHRSDIFSVGLILYEMLAGGRAFQRETMAETMTAIMKEDPPELPPEKVSPALDKVVRHCLEKRPEMRFQSARDLGFALETLATPGSAGVSPATSAGTAARPPQEESASSSANSPTRWFASLRSQTAGETPALPGRWRERIAWIAAGVFALTALALGVAYVRRPALEAEPMRFSITPGAELKAGTPQELFTPSGYRVNADRGYTVTGDGQRFLFVTSADDASVPPFTVVLNWMAEVKP